jgi:NAD(P)H dehydrogenase (quinone)
VAEAVKKGVESAGGKVSIFQCAHFSPSLFPSHIAPRIAETLPQEVLTKLHAPAKPNYPLFEVASLTEYDAFLFGIPTRYGNFPAQWKTFWDATGQLWATGALHGKYAGVFVSTATPGGGQETTVLSTISTLTHHGINFVPLGYKNTFPSFANLSEVHGGGPFGAGTFAVRDPASSPPSHSNAPFLPGPRRLAPAFGTRARRRHDPGQNLLRDGRKGQVLNPGRTLFPPVILPLFFSTVESLLLSIPK